MRRKAKRSAFTLVELLVVISIIGMLMALLFPAVQAARETGRQNTCRNNMRNLTLAVIQFEKAKQAYPGYVNELFPTNTNDVFTHRSWIFMVLPQLERMDLYEPFANVNNVATSQVQPTQELDVVKCPTNPSSGVNVFPGCSFVANTGVPDITATASLPADWNANGVFHDLRNLTGGATPSASAAVAVTRMTEAFVSTGDGTSNTMMLTENADAASWVLVGSIHGNYTGTGGPTYERQLGCNWQTIINTSTGLPSPPDTTCLINRNIGGDPTFISTAPASAYFARPAALHPNIVNMSFCDGHVRTISQDIDYGVYCLLMTPRGRAARANDGTSDLAPAYFRTTVLDEKGIQ